MTEKTLLEVEAQKYGLRDMDLLKLVPDRANPKAAIDDLVTRYPHAFARPLNGMSREQYEAKKREYLVECGRAQREAHDKRAIQRMEEKYRSTKR